MYPLCCFTTVFFFKLDEIFRNICYGKKSDLKFPVGAKTQLI